MRILHRQFTAFMKKISVNSKTVLLSDFAQQHAYICTSEIFCTIWSRIHFWITWCKNYRNHSKSSKVIAKIYCHLFYRSQSIYIYILTIFLLTLITPIISNTEAAMQQNIIAYMKNLSSASQKLQLSIHNNS